MIKPIGMQTNALGVDRIRVPRKNSAFGAVSFQGRNTQNCDSFERANARMHDAMEGAVTKTGKTHDKIESKKA